MTPAAAERLTLVEPAETGPRPWIETAAAFLAVHDAPLQYVIGELVPAGSVSLWHGEPRARKTWAGLELVIAKATGTPAFGLARLGVTAPGPAAYFSQEDSAPRVRDRLRRLLAGRGVELTPLSPMYVSVHAGINLEDPAWQETLLRDVEYLRLELVVLDPVRRFAPSADKGPSEVSAVTGFLRRIASETGAAIVILHHDVKPPANGRDDRRRSHRASGGDWFAASDAPITLEAAGAVTVAYPEDFKHSADPLPFRFRVVEAREGGLLVAGEDVQAGTESKDLALQERVLDWLKEHPRTSGRKVEESVRGASHGAVREALDALLAEGKVDRTEGPRRGWVWWITA